MLLDSVNHCYEIFDINRLDGTMRRDAQAFRNPLRGENVMAPPIVTYFYPITLGHGQQIVNTPVTRIVPHPFKCLVRCRHALIVSYITLQSRFFDEEAGFPLVPIRSRWSLLDKTLCYNRMSKWCANPRIGAGLAFAVSAHICWRRSISSSPWRRLRPWRCTPRRSPMP